MAEEGETQVNTRRFQHLTRSVVTGLVALFSTASMLVAQAGPSSITTRNPALTYNGPAIWLMEDDDTEIYLFGSIHALPPETPWRRDELMDVFEEADIVYFETSARDSGANYMDFFQIGLAEPGEGVEDVLSEAQYTLLSNAMRDVGLSIESIHGQQPWLASLTLGFISMDAEGEMAGYGVENWMERELASSREVRSLESSTAVAQAFSDLPMEAQIAMLMDGFENPDPDDMNGFESFQTTIRDWLKGNPDALYDDTMEEMRVRQPEAYAVMFTNRNTDWAEQLNALMTEETGTILVVAGAGHFTGPESVILMLEDMGWKPEQF